MSSLTTESAAPKDFQISVSSGSGRYSRCRLCAVGRRSFHCVDCITTGNFVHSSAPYSERYIDKKFKLYRIRANRQLVQDRCEFLMTGKSNRDKLQIEANLTKEKISILKLAVEQTKMKVEEKRLQLSAMSKYNAKLQAKFPRYEKRVKEMEHYVKSRQDQVNEQVMEYTECFDKLAALRRARLRQLTKYIFPVRLTYDIQDSVDEKDEFLQDMKIVEQSDKMKRVHLHIGSAWLPANGDYSLYTEWVSTHAQSVSSSFCAADMVRYRLGAGLSLAAQLTSLTASCFAIRLPYNLSFSEYGSLAIGPLSSRVRRLFACVVYVCLHARQPPPPAHTHTLTLLHALCTAAATDDQHLGRVETWVSSEMLSAAEAWWGAWPNAEADLSDEEPEHLTWTADYDNTEDMNIISSSPPQPPASLVTSAAASIASIWRGWTK